MVVYDPDSKQLVVRNDKLAEVNECPLCHRPFHQDGDETAGHSPRAANFASPEYFRLLHHSLPGSSEPSRSSSPQSRITRALAARVGPVPGDPKPLAEAEFVRSSPAPDSRHHGISSTSFSPNYFNRFFIEERELGRGGKGVVLLVKHVLDGVSLGHFAVKRIPVGDDHDWLKKVLIEVQLLQNLSHPNLVSYRHVWLEDVQITNFGPSVPCAFILQQFANEGDLHRFMYRGVKRDDHDSIEQRKQRIRRMSKHEAEPPGMSGPRRLHFDEIYAFFMDIVSGLNHLHTNGYIHRDLKASNVLLHRSGNQLRCLVSDFGEMTTETEVRRSTGATGTISYCAPEVLRRDPESGTLGEFSAKSDIWSLGLVLYFLLFAKLPYQNADNISEENEDVDLLKAEIAAWTGLENERKERPDLPKKLYVFLQRLLSLNPAQRPSADVILHALKTGVGLDEPDYSGRANATPFDSGSGASRISPLDTPTPSRSPAPSWPRQRPSNARKMTPPSKIKVSSPLTQEMPSTSSEDEKIVPLPDSSNSSLVLRSPAIEAPPRPTYLWMLQHYLHSAKAHGTFKAFIFLLKVLSLYLPCLPSAASPAIGMTALAVAAVDLLSFDFSLAFTSALHVAHLLIFGIAWRYQSLCVPRTTFWHDRSTAFEGDYQVG